MPICVTNKDLERMINETQDTLGRAALQELARARKKLAEETSDRAMLKKVLDRNRITYTEKQIVSGGHEIEIEAHSCEKVEGYSGFSTNIVFNADGSIKNMGIWE